MSLWWERLPARVLEEDEALRLYQEEHPGRLLSFRWLRDESGETKVRLELAVPGAQHELEVHFPSNYPETCPSVLPFPYGKSLSTHQFKGDGVLCLEFGPDNWHPRYTAADVVNSAWRLLALEWLAESEPIEIPSRHVAELAERVRPAAGLLLRSAAFEDALRAATSPAEFVYVWQSRSLTRIVPMEFPKGTALVGVPPAFTDESKGTGLLVSLRQGAPPKVPTDRAGFDRLIEEFGDGSVGPEKPIVLLLRWPEGRTRGFLRLPQSVIKLANVPLETGAGPRLPEDVRDVLARSKIAVVGLGSLGSKVAVSLARSGARRFVLVDGGVLQGPNVCRHAAGYSDVGLLKVDAARDLIRAVLADEPEITTHSVGVGTATNSTVHAEILESLATADLLIDATANPDAFGTIAMVASDARVPLLWGEVFGGGLGGLVASAHPDQTPCPRCVRAGFIQATHEWPPAPFASVARPYENNGGEPLVATDSDVAFIAAALTCRVADLLAQAAVPSPVTVIGLRTGWIFDSPLQSVHVPIRADDWSCPRCWTVETAPDQTVAARAEALFNINPNADDSPTR